MAYSSWKAKLRAIIKDPSSSLKSQDTPRQQNGLGSRAALEKMGGGPPSPDCNTHEPDSIVTDDIVVHFLYDVRLPLPRPNISVHHPRTSSNDSGKSLDYRWTRFICMSDAHCNTFEVPEGDILLHSGDLNYTMAISSI
ncbi:hypothetical protein FRC18_009163 [Serendipita sp. 400]|nr:hypothetical protein FRC18_009163 [Serendipita sp. 400]